MLYACTSWRSESRVMMTDVRDRVLGVRRLATIARENRRRKLVGNLRNNYFLSVTTNRRITLTWGFSSGRTARAERSRGHRNDVFIEPAGRKTPNLCCNFLCSYIFSFNYQQLVTLVAQRISSSLFFFITYSTY